MKIIKRKYIDPASLGNQILDKIDGMVTADIPATTMGQRIKDGLLALPEPVVASTQGTTSIPTVPIATAEKIDLSKVPYYKLNNQGDGGGDLKDLWDGNENAQKNLGYGIVQKPITYIIQLSEVYSKIAITDIELYNYTGGNTTDPFMVYSMNKISDTPVVEAKFVGGGYEQWVTFPAVNKSPNYLKITTNGSFTPSQIKINGTGVYTAPVLHDPITVPFGNMLGCNTYMWDFIDGASPLEINQSKSDAFTNTFTAARSFDDWNRFEQTQGGYTPNPQVPGGWNADLHYSNLKAKGMFVMPEIQSQPDYILKTWTSSSNAQNPPVFFNADFSKTASYITSGQFGYQFAGRYGKNKNVKGLTVRTSIPGQKQNTVQAGLGYVDAIEWMSEFDRWWHGDLGFQNGWDAAAMLSVFYDGHMNTMGNYIGVKNADATMPVIMGGLAGATIQTVRAIIDWCKCYRGYKADGSVNLCFDGINYHFYNSTSANQTGTNGVCPELTTAYETAQEFVALGRQYNLPIYMSETGYDEVAGSPLYVPPIGTKTTAQVKADWVLRNCLLYARAGMTRVFNYQAYDDIPGNPTIFETCGLIGKLAGTYIAFANKLLGAYNFVSTKTDNGVIIDTYTHANQTIYAVFYGTQSGKTGTYNLGVNGTALTADGKSSTISGVVNVSESVTFVEVG